MKRIIISFLVMLCAISSGAQKIICRVSGECENINEQMVLLSESGTDKRVNEYLKVPVVDGRFSYIFEADSGVLRSYDVCLESEYMNGSWRTRSFIVENANVSIYIPKRGDNRSDDNAIRINSDGKEFALQHSFDLYQDSIRNVYNKTFYRLETYRDSMHRHKLYFKPIMYEVHEKMQVATSEQRDSLMQLLPKDPFTEIGHANENKYKSTIESIYIESVHWLRYNKGFASLKIMSELLSSAKSYPALADTLSVIYNECYIDFMQNHPYNDKINMEIKAHKLKPGNKYIDYTIKNAEGKDIPLSSLYTGRVIYIDLWASWCGPCRRHAKELIPLYNKYKDSGFQIIGFAREYNEEAMVKAIKDDGYPWQNYLELKDASQIWKKNGVNNAGGGGFLIDADGTILAVYPDAEETERILKEKLK